MKEQKDNLDCTKVKNVWSVKEVVKLINDRLWNSGFGEYTGINICLMKDWHAIKKY